MQNIIIIFKKKILFHANPFAIITAISNIFISNSKCKMMIN